MFYDGNDPDTWNDNYMCVPDNHYTMRFFGNGLEEEDAWEKESCMLLSNDQQPESDSWDNNYLCVRQKVYTGCEPIE